jgi:hypothetical protein
LEKVRSIFQWLIRNIEYDKKAYQNGNRRLNRSDKDILERKKAICWGYASLFKNLCTIAGIKSEIISGYSRNNLETAPKIEEPNHAWNAVKIDSTWHLLDATWQSGYLYVKSDFEKKFGHSYFLTPPQFFIANHLPNNPNWQLLKCPISIAEYQQSPDSILSIIAHKKCISKEEVETLYALPTAEKRIQNAIQAYEFNPTEANKRELAHAHIDYETHLSETAERFQLEKQFDSLQSVQLKMIQLCETAEQLTQLFDTQKENCAYNYFNYAVLLTQLNQKQKKQDLQKWEEILDYFEKSKVKLAALPQNFFTQQAIERCDDYIDYSQRQIKRHKK